jgi:hypothetical protein
MGLMSFNFNDMKCAILEFNKMKVQEIKKLSNDELLFNLVHIISLEQDIAISDYPDLPELDSLKYVKIRKEIIRRMILGNRYEELENSEYLPDEF